MSTSRQEYPQSTNVSSPVQAATRRRNAQEAKTSDKIDLRCKAYSHNKVVMSDDEISLHQSEDESYDAWPQRPELRVPYGQKRKGLGPPITADEKIEGLNPTHRYVVDDFMVQATNECRKVSPRQVTYMHTSRRSYC